MRWRGSRISSVVSNPCGTPGVMCRKQVIGYKRAGPEVDVWSLVASLYVMLTGYFPRDFPDGMDRWLAILKNGAVPILHRNRAVPKPLAELIDRALSEEPAMPFQTAAEFKRVLEEVA
jgi:eukaryotic-like serine/threonine-protein kinase